MSFGITNQEIGEAAGHLLAELVAAKEDYRHAQISKDAFEKRVAIIRGVAARFQKAKPLESGTLALLMEDQ